MSARASDLYVSLQYFVTCVLLSLYIKDESSCKASKQASRKTAWGFDIIFQRPHICVSLELLQNARLIESYAYWTCQPASETYFIFLLPPGWVHL
jgi:hypothetical protein